MHVAAVIGSPVAHSLSPALHRAAFAAAGLDWDYVAFEVAAGSGAAAVDAMRTLGLARAVGHDARTRRRWPRRSTSWRRPPRRWSRSTPSSRDGRHARRPQHRRRRVRRRVGGRRRRRGRRGEWPSSAQARRPAASSTRSAAPAPPTSRSSTGRAERAVGAAAWRRGARVGAVGRRRGRPTSSSTPRRSAWAPTTCRSTRRSCDRARSSADLVYHPLDTALLRAAASAGCATVDGLGMLVHQAVLQQELWTGQRPDPALMRAAALAELSAPPMSAERRVPCDAHRSSRDGGRQ